MYKKKLEFHGFTWFDTPRLIISLTLLPCLVTTKSIPFRVSATNNIGLSTFSKLVSLSQSLVLKWIWDYFRTNK